MTIGIRVVGAFALVLALLLALGINAFIAIVSVGHEARKVEAGVEASASHTEFNIQLRATVARAKLYAATENTADLESLKIAVDALSAVGAKLDLNPPTAGGTPGQTLRLQTRDYLRNLDQITGLVEARQKFATDLKEALTAAQVVAGAIADHVERDPEHLPAALALLENVEAAGISALRYHSSRDPSDAEAARRWSTSAHIALGTFTAPGGGTDRRLAKLVDAFGAPLARFDRARTGLVETTTTFASASLEWEAMGSRLLNQGIRSRVADSSAQRDAAKRMLVAVRGAGVFDLIATASAIASGAILAFALIRTIARPLASITAAMRAIAAGALGTPIPSGDRRDEIGAMARAVVVFRDGLIKLGALDAEKEAERVQRRARMDVMEGLNRSFEREVGTYTTSLSEAAEQMTRSAKALLENAAQTSRRCGLVGAAALEASSGVHHVATSTAEVAAAVQEVGRRVSTSAKAASDAVIRAREADATVRTLQVGASRIGEVVGFIGALAHETNLLALNATIEAARAGPAGRGFAVVAGEVKELSIATTKASEEIGRHIGEIQNAMQGAAKTLEDIGRAVENMGENASRIAAAVEEQSAGVTLITMNATLAAAGAEDVKANIGDVEAGAACTDDAARKVLASAELVAERAEAMRARVSVFLEQARRA